MQQKAPTTAGTVTGAEIRTAEAERTLNPIIRLLAARLKENLRDVPQLQDRSQTPREAPGGHDYPPGEGAAGAAAAGGGLFNPLHRAHHRVAPGHHPAAASPGGWQVRADHGKAGGERSRD